MGLRKIKFDQQCLSHIGVARLRDEYCNSEVVMAAISSDWLPLLLRGTFHEYRICHGLWFAQICRPGWDI